MSLISIALALFLIMDPFGSISAYLRMIKGIDPKRQKLIVVREMFFALVAIFFFYFFGQYLFRLLELSETTVRLASGVILFLIALKILFPSGDSLRANIPQAEPFIIPLAIPLIAGPSLLATVMLYAYMDTNAVQMFTAILIAWFAALLVLLSANTLHRFMGNNGLIACERLMGMILVLLAIQRFMEGLKLFFSPS